MEILVNELPHDVYRNKDSGDTGPVEVLFTNSWVKLFDGWKTHFSLLEVKQNLDRSSSSAFAFDQAIEIAFQKELIVNSLIKVHCCNTYIGQQINRKVLW